MSVIDCKFMIEQTDGNLKVTVVGNEMFIVSMLCVAMNENDAIRGIMEKLMPVYEMGNELKKIIEGDKLNDNEASK